MFSTIVFLGPSLSLAEAKKILPHAYYLPPVRCGEVLQALRLKPKVIGIIDGYFENTAAVWHKEILFAIEQGVQVFGSSSMGALRASELAPFGMKVVGTIAADYGSATIKDDDEVAVLHSPLQSDYRPITDAMPNIRATLNLAYEQQVIDQKSHDSLLATAKGLFYQQRTLTKIIELTKNQLMPQQVAHLKRWLEQNHYQDNKRSDAILLLQTLASGTYDMSQPQFAMNKPAFFRALHRNVMCRPFSSYQHDLPISERVALMARFLGPEYKLIRRLAYLLAACHALAKQQGVKPCQPANHAVGFKVKIAPSMPVWQRLNDCSEGDGFWQRMAMLHGLFKQEEQAKDIPGSFKDYMLLLLRQTGDYVKLKAQFGLQEIVTQDEMIKALEQQEPNKYQLVKSIAYCWWFIERCALRIGLQPHANLLQTYSDEFRRENQLSSLATMQQWLKENDLDLPAYHYLMAATYRLNFLVLQNNLDILNPALQTENVWWLGDALWLSNYYLEAKNLLTDHAKLHLLKQAMVARKADLATYLHSLDFVQGEQEFERSVFL